MHTRFYHRAWDKSVFVTHWRHEDPRRSLFALLRSIGLNRIEGRNAIRITGRPSPRAMPAANSGASGLLSAAWLLSLPGPYYVPRVTKSLSRHFRAPSPLSFEKMRNENGSDQD
jgi:hypothetical protein